jgi:hypothetical protein
MYLRHHRAAVGRVPRWILLRDPACADPCRPAARSSHWDAQRCLPLSIPSGQGARLCKRVRAAAGARAIGTALAASALAIEQPSRRDRPDGSCWCEAATMSRPTPLSNAAAPGQNRSRTRQAPAWLLGRHCDRSMGALLALKPIADKSDGGQGSGTAALEEVALVLRP